ncbi:MAG: DUF4124 domain-containing protein [Kangiellaceae bacterium]
MNKIVTLIFPVILLAISSQAQSAKKIMYKWTDDKGEIHYTERAPKGVEYTKIATYVNENAVTKVAPEAPKEAKTDISSNYNNWKDENCTIATQNLDMLRNTARIGVDDGDGGKRLMTDEEKQEKIDSMVKQQTKYCKKEE